jgi:hypothetical protein
MSNKDALNAQKELQNLQNEQSLEQQTLQMAAAQAHPEHLEQLRTPAFLETLGDSDINDESGTDQTEDILSAELSRVNILGNLPDIEYQRRSILSQNLSERVQSEFVPVSGPGSKCSGLYRAVLLGDPAEANRPRLTPAMARKVETAIGEEGVRTAQMSLARNAKAFDGITQIHTVASTDKNSSGSSDGSGLVGSVKKTLFG